jgi:hypothetical protein
VTHHKWTQTMADQPETVFTCAQAGFEETVGANPPGSGRTSPVGGAPAAGGLGLGSLGAMLSGLEPDGGDGGTGDEGEDDDEKARDDALAQFRVQLMMSKPTGASRLGFSGINTPNSANAAWKGKNSAEIRYPVPGQPPRHAAGPLPAPALNRSFLTARLSSVPSRFAALSSCCSTSLRPPSWRRLSTAARPMRS